MPNAEDERLGRMLKTIRQSSAITQDRLAHLAGVPVKELRRIENGVAGEVELDRIRRSFESLGGRVRLSAWWNGAAADRLIDESHAFLVEAAARVFRQRGWQVRPEVSFSEFGERGSIDLLATHEEHHAVAACEIKSVFGSLEELNRSMDVKMRLLPKISRRVLGWAPSSVGRLLIVPSDSTIRRAVARHSTTMGALYPARGRDVRLWLRQPTRDIAAIWFVSFRRN